MKTARPLQSDSVFKKNECKRRCEPYHASTIQPDADTLIAPSRVEILARVREGNTPDIIWWEIHHCFVFLYAALPGIQVQYTYIVNVTKMYRVLKFLSLASSQAFTNIFYTHLSETYCDSNLPT